MRFDAMHHAAIIVSDYEKAREFYVEKLGFPVLRENYREDPYIRGKMTFFHDPDGLPLELHE